MVENPTHAQGLYKVPANSVNVNTESAGIESLLKETGCRVVEVTGLFVTFELNCRIMTIYRLQLDIEALRYRVHAVLDFIEDS